MLLRRRGVRLIPPTYRYISTPSRSLILPLTSSRGISTQRRPSSTLTATDNDSIPPHSSLSHTTPSPSPLRPTPLATLPTSYLLRTIFICTISTSPVLSNILTRALLAYTHFLTSNPLTRFLIQHTFYDHFCAGTSHPEIQTTLARLKSWGFRGIILAYAKEVEVEASSASATTSSQSADEQSTAADIAAWRDGNIRTIEYSEPGSFIAIKYSGAGASSVLAMEARTPPPPPPSPAFFKALDDICLAAQARGNVRLLFDAEQTRYQDAMDGYTLALMRKYNSRDKPPTVYNTYQMYRRASPSNLSKHLETAKREGFAFGAKVVRGAYLHSDPRETFWSTKEQTDAAYDAGISTLLTFNNSENGGSSETDSGINVGMVIATHNQESVDAAMTLLRQLKATGGHTLQRKDITFAQLAGMADEVSMSVINGDASAGEPVNVVKYIPWGTMEECVKYLLRRADENKDSLKRTGSTRRAAWDELWRRVFGRA
ncbi:proline dehydrogenase [Orbilia brochopaga]|uniref:Proline dehydrogenase n=1 Tax=Orbilia brochopaga TaxID=3140254 RepID=A0AAV9UBV5_9PEZI